MLPMDLLLIIVTAQLLQEVQQAYENENFHEMWTLLTHFCEKDLRFYTSTMESRSTTTRHAAQSILSEIATLLLQQFAPLTPFFSEYFYECVSVDGVARDHSIFQGNWRSHRTLIERVLPPSDAEKDEVKAEWEEVKKTYNAKS